MNETLPVRIVRLAPAEVISAYGFGPSPESIAWNKLLAWLKQTGRLDTARSQRFFGFNNPDPSPASPNYGYEQWMTVPAGVQPAEDLRLVAFLGGLYAVAHCSLQNIFQIWQELVAWREDSRYKPAYHPCLEECLTPPLDGDLTDLEFDLYIPIAE